MPVTPSARSPVPQRGSPRRRREVGPRHRSDEDSTIYHVPDVGLSVNPIRWKDRCRWCHPGNWLALFRDVHSRRQGAVQNADCWITGCRAVWTYRTSRLHVMRSAGRRPSLWHPRRRPGTDRSARGGARQCYLQSHWNRLQELPIRQNGCTWPLSKASDPSLAH